MFDGDGFSEHSDFRANAEFRVFKLHSEFQVLDMSLVSGPLSAT